MQLNDYSIRIGKLIGDAQSVLSTTTESSMGFRKVNGGLFMGFRTASLSLITSLYGESHPFYKNFDTHVSQNTPYDTEEGREILKAIKYEVDNGYLISVRGLISGKIFTDFLEMSQYLLNENYKDAAAVMIGSVLEEHLRELCLRNSIPIEIEKDGKMIPKKADRLNSDLYSGGVIVKLDNKNVTGWFEVRNNAAHGKYDQYNLEQVRIMESGVSEFISRTKT
ncbi:MAG: hypothetical protein O9262_01160 [Cyclobacteriaceae bacterium]|nr:hypothetical protein [Cyclobacteriaceae bacterium]